MHESHGATVKLSVVIPCFNASSTIGFQLEALARQQWDQTWEVIVVDNNSTDDTIERARAFEGHIPGLRVVPAPAKQGPAHARNTGAATALGESLAFCDADDEVAPGWVAAMGTALEEHHFVAGKWELEKLNPPWVRTTRGAGQAHGLQQYTYPPYLPHAGGGSLGVRRKLHLEIGGFDESLRILEDTDYCWRLQLAGYELTFVPDAVTHIRFRQTTRATFAQARGYGAYNVVLYRRYRRHGMPRLGWTRGAKVWIKLLLGLPHMFNWSRRSKWVRQFGWHLGRLEASVLCRTPVIQRKLIRPPKGLTRA